MTYKTIKFSKQEKIATITLNDPATRNAITDPILLEEVKVALRAIQDDQDVSVCILTGEGKGFSSGGNVKDMLNREKMFAGDALELQNNYRNGIHSLSKLLYSFEIPTIAAVNGAAAGAGFDLALLCDLRIGSERATFTSSFLNLAVIPGDGASWLLRKTVGAQRAAELVLTGRTVKAEEALDMGLLLKLVKHEALMDSARELAAVIAGKSRETLIITKRLLRSTDSLGYEDHLNLCSANQGMLHRAAPHEEALKRFFNREKE
ncbi:MAG: enoyl-CoA hydratase [Gammaproteobacteria bacterium]|nr:MAG: enoyl-CoA hydratase [Gammaproteobacteria bacterium]RLA21833.1 MAG: enoyl-CoA hydratase [Gammaproteobacteria bacterium]